jgi:hypothetical protein
MAGNQKYIVQGQGKWTDNHISTPTTVNTEQVHVCTYIRNGTTMILKQHNNPPIVKPGTGSYKVKEEYNLLVGPRKGTKPYFYVLGDRQAFGADKQSNAKPVDLLELIVFKEALPEEKMQEMYHYLQQKYQFEVPLV